MTAETERKVSRRQRAIDLAVKNRAWIQYHLDDMLDKMPGPAAWALVAVLNKKMDLKRENVWELIPRMLAGMTDEDFEQVAEFVEKFLAA